jgi:tetratricopeptide (TPR) repeat protein
MGNVDLALAKYEHAATLEPVDGGLLEVAESKLLLRNYAEAEEVFDRILELAPNHSPSLAYKAAIPLYRDGDVRELRRAADEGGFSHENPWTTPGPIMGWTASIYEKRFEDALAFLGAWDASAWPHQGYASKDGLYALTYELAGRPAEAAAHWQRALAHIEGVLDQNAQYPEAWMAHAEALARLGSPDAAITEAYRVIDHYERAGDELYGAERRLDAVRRVFVPVGAFVDAFMLLDRYLSGNGRWAVESLAKDPRLEPIRDDPLFGDLLKKYGRNEPDHERSR